MIHNLPPELLLLVLKSVSSGTDLRALIAASPACFHLFIKAKADVLSSVISNTHPEILRHALALSHVPVVTAGRDVPTLEDARSFLDKYTENHEFNFPKDPASIISLERSLMHVSRFTDAYFLCASETLDCVLERFDMEDFGEAPQYPTETETIKIHRAFLRYEIYSKLNKLCPRCSIDSPDSIEDAYLQFRSLLVGFLRRIEPWEVEEMNSILAFFTLAAHVHFDQLEEFMIDTVLEAPGVEVPRGHDPRLLENKYTEGKKPIVPKDTTILRTLLPRLERKQVSPTAPPDECGHADPTIAFGSLGYGANRQYGVGRLFTKYERQTSYIDSLLLADHGLEFFHKLSKMVDADEWMHILKRAGLEARDLSKLSHRVLEEFRTEPPKRMPADLPGSGPLSMNNMWAGLLAAAYTYVNAHPREPIERLAWNAIHPLLRLGAWVFWDDARIEENKRIFGTLRIAGNMKELYWHGKLSVEERLSGIRMPLSQFRAIEERFGKTWFP